MKQDLERIIAEADRADALGRADATDIRPLVEAICRVCERLDHLIERGIVVHRYEA